MSHHTSLEEHIEQVISQGEEQDEFIDSEYLDSQCPNCKIVFPDDDSLLRHICSKEGFGEY